MFINFKFLLITCPLNLVMPAFPFQPSGGVLSLDGVDDYAILCFGFLFPKNTQSSLSMWFYPKDGPKQDNIIFSQQLLRIDLKPTKL